MDYKIIWGTTPDLLNECIQEYMNAGWEPYRAPFVGYGYINFTTQGGKATSYFCQPMIRKDEDQD